MEKQDKDYNSGWILRTDSLPSSEGSYLVTTKNGAVRVVHYYPSNKTFSYRDDCVAWRPLPKPYKEE